MNASINNAHNKNLNRQFDLISAIAAELKGSSLHNAKKSFKKKEHVYYTGKEADEIYIIVKGSIKVEKKVGYDNVLIKNIFSKGDLFGEVALLNNATRADFAVALEETELYVFRSIDFNRYMRYNSNLTAYILELINKRLIEAELKIESFAFNNSRTRIINFLLDLVKTSGQRLGFEILVRKFFTHQEIANSTATSRQTVTTVLNQLKRDNLINFNRKRLLVRDINLLKKQLFK